MKLSNSSKHLPIGAIQHHRNAKYTRRVQKLRKALPFFASILFMLIIFWPEMRTFLEKSSLPETNIKKMIQGRNRLSSPRFQSIDEKGRPYYLTAKNAIQKNNHTADLEVPYSKMQMEDGAIVEINSDIGFYNDLTKKLDYKDNVKLRSDTGYDLRTSLAHVNLENKQADGDRDVEGEGPTGKIWAQGFHTTQGGVIHFKGKSRLIIDKNKQATPREKS